MKKKAKAKANVKPQVASPPQRQVKKRTEPEIRYFDRRGKVKSTNWERSYMSLLAAVIFLLLALWYIVYSSKG